MNSHSKSARDVFCNFPFDAKYERHCIALVASLLCTGQTPRSVLEVPATKDRLSRLVDLIAACPFSIHDLSNVRLSSPKGSFRVPRFNMPFELGLVIALKAKAKPQHQWAVLESTPYRLQHSLSDLNGYDPTIHHNTVEGMFAAICDVFADARPFPIDDEVRYLKVFKSLLQFRRLQFGSASMFTRDRFGRLVVAGHEYVRRFAER